MSKRELTRAEIDALYGGAARVRDINGKSVPLVRDGVELQTRAAAIDTDAIDIENRTIPLAFSSEAEYERWFGIEILDHSKKSIRMDRLKEGVPVCADHWLEKRLGKLLKPSLGEDRKMRGVAKLSRVRPEAEYELQDAADGIPSQVSVGYFVHKMVLEEERDDGPSIYRVTDWEPFEVSFVSSAADQTVGVGRAVDNDGGNMPKNEKTEPEATAPEVEVKTDETPAPDTALDPAPVEVRVSDDDKAERKRIGRINAIADVAEERRPGAHDLAQKYIADGGEPEAYQKELAAMADTPSTPTPEIGLTQSERREFSLIKAIRALANPDDRRLREDAAFEFEVSQAARDKYGRERGAFTIPDEVLQRDLAGGSLTTGGALISTDSAGQGLIDLLRNELVTGQLGATVLDGLVGDVSIPKITGGCTAYWVRDSAVTESDQTFGQINLTPKTVGAMTDIKRSLLKQSSPSAEMIVQNDLMTKLAHEIDDAAINGAGANGEPQGCVNVTGIGSSAVNADGSPTYNELADIWAEVAKDNINITRGGWLTEASLMAYLMSSPIYDAGGGVSGGMMAANGMVLGYPIVWSNVVTSNGIYFANWSDLIIALWGGVDLTVDPYTGSSAGTLRVVALQDADIALRHAQSFAYGS